MVDAAELRERVERDSGRCRALVADVSRTVIGQRALVEGMLLGAVCEGHVLLEGVPGLGKTLAARSFAAAVQGTFTRIQFTPDLLPGDLTGTEVFDPDGRQFVPRLGPVVTNVLLADEINRAPAKVQSALLEAMEERQVTIGGTHLPAAAAVPRARHARTRSSSRGRTRCPKRRWTASSSRCSSTTPPTPTSARSWTRTWPPKPGRCGRASPPRSSPRSPRRRRRSTSTPASASTPCGSRAPPVTAAPTTRRPSPTGSRYGASPRASIALARAAQALALLRGRSYAIPEDVKEVAPAILRHRLVLTLDAQAEGIDVEQLVRELLLAVEVP